MTEEQKILKEASDKLAALYNHPVNVVIKGNKNIENIELYCEIWLVCFTSLLDFIKSRSYTEIYPMAINAQVIYIDIIIENFVNPNISLIMNLIGKDRTTYYYARRMAKNHKATKDDSFMKLYDMVTMRMESTGLTDKIKDFKNV
jgi:hypothetical protein